MHIPAHTASSSGRYFYLAMLMCVAAVPVPVHIAPAGGGLARSHLHCIWDMALPGWRAVHWPDRGQLHRIVTG